MILIPLLLLLVASPLFFVDAVNTQNRTLDEVTYIPGWSPKPFPAKMYSGYLDNGANGYLHYLWQFPQQGDAETAQIVIFSNGGPGCSSFGDGAFYELGMFQLYERNVTNPANATDAPMYLNPFAWNRNAHVIFFTHSAGVAPAFGESAASLEVDDHSDGVRNFVALKNLFTYKFPEYKNNKIWLAGESYFGIYSMMLTEQILNYLDAGNTDVFQNFRGVMVGNGVTDDAYDDNFAMSTGLFAHGHGMITGDHFSQICTDCVDTPYSDACLAQWDKTLPANLNVYGFVQWCYNPGQLSSREQNKRAEIAADTTGTKKMLTSDYRHFEGHMNRRSPQRQREQLSSFSTKPVSRISESVQSSASSSEGVKDSFAASYTPAEQQYMNDNFPGITPVFGTNYYDLDCTDEYYSMEYFSRNDFKMAFHLPLNFNFTVCWNFPYKKTVFNVVPIYERLRKRDNITIVIYNGIQDLIVPYTGTWSWMENHGWEQLSDYAPWSYVDELRPLYGSQSGGWVMRIGSPNTYFVSLRSAGHMAPQVGNAPAASFDMLTRVLSGELWDVPLSANPKPFKGQFINPNHETSLMEKGKYIGIGFGICIGVFVLVVIVVVILNKRSNQSKFERQRHAEQQGVAGPETATYYTHTA